MRNWSFIVLFAILVSGCAQFSTGNDVESINQAGITSIRIEPVEVAGKSDRAYTVIMGRETDDIEFDLTWTDDGHPIVHVHAQGVKAFEGQAAAATAVVAIQSELAKMGVEMTPELTDALKTIMAPIP